MKGFRGRDNAFHMFQSGTIANRLLLLMLFFLIVPCLVINYGALYFTKYVVYDNYMEQYLEGIYQDVQDQINEYIYQINMFSTAISTNTSIYSIWNNESLPWEDKEQRVKAILDNYLAENHVVSHLQLKTNDGHLISVGEPVSVAIEPEFDQEIRPTKIAVYHTVVFGDDGKGYLVFGKKFYSFQSGYHLGSLYLFIPEELISSVYKGSAEDGSQFFITSGGRVISHADKNYLNQVLLVPEGFYNSDFSYNAQVTGYVYRAHQLSLDAVATQEWEMVCLLNCNNLYSTVSLLQDEVKVIILFMAILSVILSFLLSRSLIRSMSQLRKRMARFVQGKEDKVSFEYREFVDLENQFDKMVKEIKDLIQKNNEEKEKQRIAELKALQAQINPHFMYNALDAIIWHAKLKNQEYLADMVYELATFFKISLHKGENFIYVWEEIKHVESYVKIEQMRFPNLFEIHYRIQEDILQTKILKIILQPLVENAIKHGFEYIESGGVITIVGYSDGDDLVFEIEDNGVGMKFDPLSVAYTSNGYGIKNVHERLVLEYGQGYGLTFYSEEGKGTRVVVRLKAK